MGYIMLYSRLSIRDHKKKIGHFLIGCCSIYLVVFIVVLLIMCLNFSPIIFLVLSEQKSGEMDMDVTLQLKAPMNYTKVVNIIKENLSEDYQLHTPRWKGANAYAHNILSCSSYNSTIESEVDYVVKSHKKWFQTRNYLLNDCSRNHQISTYLLDMQREKKIEICKNWKYKYPSNGKILISNVLANDLKVSINDTIIVSFSTKDMYAVAFNEVITNIPSKIDSFMYSIPYKVEDIFTISQISCKFGTISNNYIAIIEMTTFFQDVAEIHQKIAEMRIKSNELSWAEIPAYPLMYKLQNEKKYYEDVNDIVFNLPEPRSSWYLGRSFDNIAKDIIKWSSEIAWYLGYHEIYTSLDVLKEFKENSTMSSFLNLTFTIIVLLLVLLSIFLINCLMMVSVESKTHQLGIQRMVGMKRKNMIFMILVHGISYSLPGTALAFLTAQILILYFQPLIEETLKHSITPILTFKAVICGVGLGLIVPVVASYFPIRKALSSNIRDSLDRRHNQTSGYIITVENKLIKAIKANKTLLAIGGSFSIIGGLLCYFLPSSLIIIEQIVLYIVFLINFWEKKGISIITRKNLISHRMKNRKTAVMFAMSITCIIFLQSVSDVELNSMEYSARLNIGADARVFLRNVFNNGNFWNSLKNAEDFLKSIPEVKDWAYYSENFERKIAINEVKISNIGRVDPYKTYIRAISPNFFDVAEPTFGKLKHYYTINELDNELSLIQSEQLYSFEGENRMIFSLAFKDEFVTEGKIDDKLVLKMCLKDVFYWKETQPLSYLESAPVSTMSKKLMSNDLTSLVSFPTMYELGKDYFNSIKDIPIQFMIISYQSNITSEIKNKIKSRILTIFNMRVNVDTLDDQLEFTKDVRIILNYAFSAITIAFSLIAFFSLSNIMYMNIMEQKQEIGILRSLGLNRFGLIKIYIYEGFTILMSAGILGIIIGYILGVTIMKQRTEFLQMPLSFTFPYVLILVVIGCCLVSAILATLGPLLSLSKQSKIIKLLKE
ncbi:FtsX-domain-containing protein [Anaeromyces robustus]|uniref:FtsX-domain-containing protein n=1 Tax=Anaeromyces robustus TaxID=1754192 RepID=A0A1Y1WTT8_9FUNG|nr:FtsX-domain-containing protein [Anaeromyces robustus]|eukprot:ORX76815.1 FtsX-domain-containing protein [Anaeromyces robustus]